MDFELRLISWIDASTMKTLIVKAGFVLLLIGAGAWQVLVVPTTIDDFFMPGSQPGDSGNLENPDKCDNCHGGYDEAVEPAFNWRGSMMAQAARDPLFFAAMSIANQDAPESGDLCIRCHSPKGWLEGRSTPTDGSSLTTADREGVQCDFCHKLIKPTDIGVNPYPGDADYTNNTYGADQAYLQTLTNLPEYSANGMYIADENNAKRGPYTDPNANHQFYYSPFHRESALCGTCHDVSNPAFSAVLDNEGNIVDYVPNDFGTPAPDFSPYRQFPVERTYSEWLKSAYNSPTGIPSDDFGGNLANVATCQDCHMKDLSGVGCNKNGAPLRNDLPHHDMTGGNTFIPLLIDDVFPGETDTAALNAGIERARYMLQHAATMEVIYDTVSQIVEVYVENQCGHKLPSGYPEGRRMWIHVEAWGENGEYYESGHYNYDSAMLYHDADIKVYEIKPGISEGLAPVVGLPVGPSFHFVLNDTVFKDNRIPPRGFTNANFEEIQSPPVGYSYADSQFWDITTYPMAFSPIAVRGNLYYQTTTREYVEFLRDENVTDDWGNVMYNLWESHGKSPPELMQQATWGDPIIDNDEDGYPTFTDCNDSDPLIHPDAEELADCIDNSCDGFVDYRPNNDAVIYWTGCGGTAQWMDPSNWNSGKVPHDTQYVIIPTAMAGDSFPVLRDSVQVKQLTIEQGATLTIAPEGFVAVQFATADSALVIVHGDLDNHGEITVESSVMPAIEITSSGIMTNEGLCSVTFTTQWGILNHGHFVNEENGQLTMTSSGGLAIDNRPGAHFTNKGTIEVIYE